MLEKDKFLEKINLLILIIVLCFSHNLYAKNIYEKVFNYNERLKNSSAKFIQTDTNYLQEGVIFFGTKRIKITYKNPQKITIILSEKKGVYINHELEESEFFSTTKSYIKIFFDILHNKNHLKKMIIQQRNDQIVINEQIELDNIFYNVKLIYENDPIKLRRLEITSDNEKIQIGFFDHSIESIYNKNFFSMVDPYLN